MEAVNVAVTGKTKADIKTEETNRMIKLLSIASGKTTAEQEAEAGSIPYSQYIKQKEAEQNKNTAENSGADGENSAEISVDEKILNTFGITKLNDTLHVQKKVLETLEHEGFWENEKHSTTVVNNDSEMDIVINESGIEETFSYKHFTKLPKDLKIKKLITVRFLPQIIQKGVVVSDDVENYHDKNSSIKYTYIDCIVEIDGEPSVVTVAIRKSPQKNKFWVHQVDINKNAGSTPTGTSESSKTGYLTSDNTVIISSDDIIVNKNISDDMYADSFSDEKRAKKRERVETLAEKLGLKLNWSSEVTEGKYNPKTREVTLNPNLTAGRMYMFIFKHEFVHDLENRKGYKSFKNYLFNISKTFVDYCETELLNKYGIQASGKDAVAILTDKVYDAWTASEELSENEKAAFDKEAAEREIVCNYVADRLLGGLREGGDYEQESYDALVELADTHRNIFQRFVDWVKDIINMIKGEPTFNDMADELQYLNERLAKVYDSRIQNSGLSINKHSLIIKHIDGTVEKMVDARSLTNEQTIGYLEKTKKGVFKWNSYIPVRSDTPQVIIDTLENAGEEVENCSLVMQVRKAQQAMSIQNKGGKSKQGNNVRSHALTPREIVEIINNLDNPSTMILQTNRHDKNGNALPNNVAVFVEYGESHSEGLAVIEFESTIDNEFIGEEFGETNFHTVVTIFEPDIVRDGMPFDYVEELLQNPNNYELNIERRQPVGSAIGKKHPNTSNELPSNYSVPDNSKNVNKNSSDNETHSVLVPFSDEFKADKRKKYAQGLANKYGGAVQREQLEGYLKEIAEAVEDKDFTTAFNKSREAARYIAQNSSYVLEKAVYKKLSEADGYEAIIN